MVAAIFRLTFTITLQGRTPASTSTRNLQDEVSFGVRAALPVLCPLQGIFHYNILMTASGVVIPLTRIFIVRRT